MVYTVFDFVVRGHQLIKLGSLDVKEWHRIVKIIFKQMIEAIEFIHSNKVAHMDISYVIIYAMHLTMDWSTYLNKIVHRLENWLLNDVPIAIDKDNDNKLRFLVDDNGKGLKLKICDFGLAEYFNDTKNWKSDKYCGKRNYQSPEITLGHNEENKKYFNAKKNDIFCLGVCFFMS